MNMLTLITLLAVSTVIVARISSRSPDKCVFAREFSCEDFSRDEVVKQYLNLVMNVEGQGFAQPGVGYDSKTGRPAHNEEQ